MGQYTLYLYLYLCRCLYTYLCQTSVSISISVKNTYRGTGTIHMLWNNIHGHLYCVALVHEQSGHCVLCYTVPICIKKKMEKQSGHVNAEMCEDACVMDKCTLTLVLGVL